MTGKYVIRGMEKILKQAAKQFPSVIITGPRQSGKTTLLKHLFAKSHKYVSMDNPDLRLMATKEPGLFFENYAPPLIIDEIQYAPQLLSHIKIIIDKNRATKGQFILTGSQIFPLMAKAGESLAGRIAVFTLLPFSFKEEFGRRLFKNLGSTEGLKRKILIGGFPEVALAQRINLELWFGSYLQTYLERDVRQLRQIGDLGDFQKFLQLLAALNGQIINFSSLSRDLGIAVNTIKAWASILEASGQIILIKPFYFNKGKRIIKSPKVYFLDTGLLCYLSGISSNKQIFKGPFSGQMLETAMVGEVAKNFYNQGKVPRIYWWRTSHGDEVDFVIENKGRIIPVEVKLSANINSDMAKGLISFCNLFREKINKAFLVSLSKEKLTIQKKIIAIPFAEFVEQLQ